jgi:hypothetical protein
MKKRMRSPVLAKTALKFTRLPAVKLSSCEKCKYYCSQTGKYINPFRDRGIIVFPAIIPILNSIGAIDIPNRFEIKQEMRAKKT